MKRLFIILTMLALMPFASINAQDARGRVTSTIVADALAQLPAETPDQYNQVMGELAATGSEGIAMLGSMLKPAGEGVKNATIEYALNGVASYVSKGQESLRAGVREGLKTAVAKVSDNPNKAFLLTVLEVCATADDAKFFAGLLGDEYLGNFAARSLATLDGTEDVVLELMQNQNANGLSKTLLAQIASYKPHFHGAEDILVEWSKNATPEEAAQINNALALSGGEKAAKVLAAAAKAAGYAFETTDAYGAYLTLLNGHLMKHNPKAVEAAAKQLMKVGKDNVRLAGLDLMVQLKGEAAMPIVLKALKDASREYRYGAMRASEAYADDKTYAAVAAAMPRLSDDAKIDVVNWLGANHAASQIDAVCAQIGSGNDAVAEAAISAASKIGGDKALKAILAKVESASKDNSELLKVAEAALLSFNGKINAGIVEALDGGEVSKLVAYGVLKTRRIPEAAAKVLAAAEAGDASAAEVVGNVVTEKNFDAVCNLYENGKIKSFAAVNKAIEEKPAADQVKMIEARMAKAGDKKHIYYPVLAATGSTEVIPTLIEGYKAGNKDNAAFGGMCSINDDAMIQPMYDIAKSSAELKDAALNRYIALVKASKKLNGEQKYMKYRQALETEPKTAIKNTVLSALSATQTYQGMMLAAEYMDNAETAQAAANTVLEIATKHPEFYSAEVKALLEKVGTTLNDGDAVYKRKDIEKFISENKERESHSIITKLSAEEEAEGFELLFDGVSMDKWQGNTTAYQPIDGYMYVTASYGSTGNLYSVKEYDDFVLRFEFCFDRAGVNNGVGIRTPMGVDAAYHGMEIQILDHDDPIYANLREYQVHGSVYGIIPAKRIVSPALGTWNTEEIRAKGDHITVIVNGEVIVDGNIRKACKGHNVAPDGSGKNPYTVDHLNHPGLFNKKGHIGFLGHGQGIKLRNVRIKELK